MKTLTIPSHSVLALLDRELRIKGVKPVYVWNVYHNTLTRKKEAGILLHSFEGHTVSFDKKYKPHIGILGFVNGKEPGEGSIPLHEVIPKTGDMLALAYIIQGIYKGNFTMEKTVQGLELVHAYKVNEKDIEEKPYEIPVQEMTLLSEES